METIKTDDRVKPGAVVEVAGRLDLGAATVLEVFPATEFYAHGGTQIGEPVALIQFCEAPCTMGHWRARDLNPI